MSQNTPDNVGFRKANWIPIYRKILEWEWYNNSSMVHLWLHLLIKASFDNTTWRGISLMRGQLITGRHQLTRETGIKESTIRNCLKRLKLTDEITIKTTKQYSIITINKYDCYQFSQNLVDQQNSQQSARKITKKSPTNNQQITTYNKEDKLIMKEYNKSDNLLMDETNSLLINSIIEEFKFRFQEYHKTEYLITNMSKEVNAAKGIIKLYRSQSNESSTDSIVEDLSSIFKACVCINNRWLRDNMSLSLILSRFNQINITLKNGKDRQNSTNGATDAELAEIISQIRPAKE